MFGYILAAFFVFCLAEIILLLYAIRNELRRQTTLYNEWRTSDAMFRSRGHQTDYSKFPD